MSDPSEEPLDGQPREVIPELQVPEISTPTILSTSSSPRRTSDSSELLTTSVRSSRSSPRSSKELSPFDGEFDRPSSPSRLSSDESSDHHSSHQSKSESSDGTTRRKSAKKHGHTRKDPKPLGGPPDTDPLPNPITPPYNSDNESASQPNTPTSYAAQTSRSDFGSRPPPIKLAAAKQLGGSMNNLKEKRPNSATKPLSPSGILAGKPPKKAASANGMSKPITNALTIHLDNGQVHSTLLLPDRTLTTVIEKLCEHRSDLDPTKAVIRDMDGTPLDGNILLSELNGTDIIYGIPAPITPVVDDDDLRLDIISRVHSLDAVHIDQLDEFMQTGQLLGDDSFEIKTEHETEFTRRKLKDIVDKMHSKGSGLVVKTRRLRLRNYDNCFTASDVVQWIIDHLNVSRAEAISIGKGFQREGFINHVTFRYNFDDSKDLLFRFSDDPETNSSETSTTGSSGLLTARNTTTQSSAAIKSSKGFDDVRQQARCHSVFWNPAPPEGRQPPSVTDTQKRKSFGRVMYLRALSSYVPNVVLREFVQNPVAMVAPISNKFPACVLFADISGFTPLCETCAKQGSRGVEVLTSHLNEYFGRMINLILNHGGDIVKFAGDALVAIFPTSDPRGLGYSCLLASQCALAMQEHLDKYDADGCLLTLHIGIGAGEISGIVVGGVAGRMEFLIAGQPMDQVAACEAAAKSGEVFISYEAASLIKNHIEVSVDVTAKNRTKRKKIDLAAIEKSSQATLSSALLNTATTAGPSTTPMPMIGNIITTGSSNSSPSGSAANLLADPRIYRLDRVIEPIALPPNVSLPHFKNMKKFISPFVQPAVLGHLNSGSPDHFLAELRNVSVIFVSLGLKYSSDVLEKLQQAVVAMQQAVQFYEGTIRQFIIDDKGSVLIAAFGLPPLSHEDDPCRAVQSAMMLQKKVSELGIETSVGVTTGKAFCGAVGSEERREYAMVGDIVNLSARLMSKADGGILCDKDTYNASKSRIAFKTLTPIHVKGKTAPIDIFAPQRESSSSSNLNAFSTSTFSTHGLSSAIPGTLSLLHRPGTISSGGTRKEFLKNVKSRFLTSRSMNSQLIGRTEPLSRLNSLLTWLQDPFSKDDPSRFVLIEGDAGIGKSFLLGNFVKSVQKNNNIRPLVGSTFSIESTTPYFAWRDIVTTILEVDNHPAVDKDAKRNAVLEVLKNRFSNAPELMDYVSLINAVVPLDLMETDASRELTGQPRADKLEYLLVKLLERSSFPLLILENAQWLDSASWRLILAAIQSLKNTCIIVSTRPMDRQPAEVEKLLALENAIRLQLEPLNKEETIEIVAQKLGVTTIPPAVGEIVHEKGGGNPLLLSELADALLAGGQIEISNQGECRATPRLTRQLSSVGIPNTLRGLITGKVDRLPQNQQLILKAASVIGRVFEADLVQEILKSVLKVTYSDPSAFLNDMNSLEAMDFISLKSEDPLSYTFQQIMTQEVIYDLMLYAQRRQLHEKIANWYEASASQQMATYTLLAHHYRKAEVLDKAVIYYSKSGEQASANFANREAVSFFNEAIELQTSLNPTEPTSSKLITTTQFCIISWKRQLGQAFYNLGLLEKASRVLESALEALNEPVRIKLGTELLSKLKAKRNISFDPQILKTAKASTMSASSLLSSSGEISKMNSAAGGSPSNPTSLKTKGRTASVIPLIPAAVIMREHILILLTLGKVYYYACNLKGLTYCNLAALKKAEELGVSRELCEAYGGAILTCSIHEKYELADAYIEIGTNLTSHFSSGTDNEPLMNLLQAAGTYFTGVQQWAKAEESFKKVIQLAKSVGNSRCFEEASIFLSIAYFLQGKIRESQALTEEAVASARRRGDAQSQVLAFNSQARNMLALGQTEKAKEALGQIEKLAVHGGEGYKLDVASEINFHALMSLCYLAKKDFELAFRTAETIIKFIDETEPTAFFTFTGYMTAPEVFCIVLQEHYKIGGSFKLRGAMTPASVLSKIDRTLKHLANFAKTFTFAEPRLILWQGVVEALGGKPDKAVITYKKSLGQAQKFGMLYDQGVALFRIGKCSDIKDKREVVEEKLAAYDKAIDIFDAIGAVYTELLMD